MWNSDGEGVLASYFVRDCLSQKDCHLTHFSVLRYGCTWLILRPLPRPIGSQALGLRGGVGGGLAGGDGVGGDVSWYFQYCGSCRV